MAACTTPRAQTHPTVPPTIRLLPLQCPDDSIPAFELPPAHSNIVSVDINDSNAQHELDVKQDSDTSKSTLPCNRRSH